ncbi:hypothetical protein GN956_G6386 [Arapaima gigas]
MPWLKVKSFGSTGDAEDTRTAFSSPRTPLQVLPPAYYRRQDEYHLPLLPCYYLFVVETLAGDLNPNPPEDSEAARLKEGVTLCLQVEGWGPPHPQPHRCHPNCPPFCRKVVPPKADPPPSTSGAAQVCFALLLDINISHPLQQVGEGKN